MKVIPPLTITDAQILSTNVTEPTSEWASGTTYAEGDQVSIATAKKVYESAQGSNTGNDPETDDGTWWIEVSSTNKWRAFDQKIADATSQSGTVEYVIQPSLLVTGIAFFNLNAPQVRVQVEDTTTSPNTETYDQTQALVDDSAIVDWFTFFTEDLSNQQIAEALFTGIPGYPTSEITITVGDGSGTPSVGEIALGKVIVLGTTLEGTSIGLTSFSTKEQDDFGNFTIVPRAKSDPIDFEFSVPASSTGRIKKTLDRLRDTPAVYFADEDLLDLGAITYGLFQEYDIPLRGAGVSIVTLEVEGLI